MAPLKHCEGLKTGIDDLTFRQLYNKAKITF